jgi:hypothetical protein
MCALLDIVENLPLVPVPNPLYSRFWNRDYGIGIKGLDF